MAANKFWKDLRRQLREIIFINDEIDTVGAAARIRGNIWFRGPNAWILAFSVVIASVGLNVNSTAVIIGAMLISPLMGPIIGVGFSLGTSDIDLLRQSLRNLLVMVVISLLAATLYFLVTPLNLANPTELEARTHPTIYDVLIALFGGLAGILENARRERGTVLSGVAIATALMPPLCTAGYGLANAEWAWFFGALYLFVINSVFIILATYLMCGVLRFHQVEGVAPRVLRRRRTVIGLIIIAVTVPSLLSAYRMVRENDFEKHVQSFVTANKTFSKGYIYDYRTFSEDGQKAEVFIAGEPLDEETLDLLLSSAERHGLHRDQLLIRERTFGTADKGAEKLMRGIYERADVEIGRKDAEIAALQAQLAAARGEEIPYVQVVRELKYRYPALIDVTLARGATVSADSLTLQECLNVIATTRQPLGAAECADLADWLKVRLDDTTVVVRNIPVR